MVKNETHHFSVQVLFSHLNKMMNCNLLTLNNFQLREKEITADHLHMVSTTRKASAADDSPTSTHSLSSQARQNGQELVLE